MVVGLGPEARPSSRCAASGEWLRAGCATWWGCDLGAVEAARRLGIPPCGAVHHLTIDGTDGVDPDLS
jgi:hypothetical protein